jgi:hypothetical protein
MKMARTRCGEHRRQKTYNVSSTPVAKGLKGIDSVNLRCRELNLSVDLDEDSAEINSPDMKESSMFALTSTSIKVPAYFSREMNYSIIKPHLDLPTQERVTFM